MRNLSFIGVIFYVVTSCTSCYYDDLCSRHRLRVHGRYQPVSQWWRSVEHRFSMNSFLLTFLIKLFFFVSVRFIIDPVIVLLADNCILA